MKNLLLALALTGLTYTSAEAQSSANSKFAKNYRVCLVGDKYQVCNENTPIATNLGRTTETATSFGMQNTYVHMGYSTGGNKFFIVLYLKSSVNNIPFLFFKNLFQRKAGCVKAMLRLSYNAIPCLSIITNR